MSRNLNTPPSYEISPRPDFGHRLETRGGARLIGFVKYWIPVGSTWRQNGIPYLGASISWQSPYRLPNVLVQYCIPLYILCTHEYCVRMFTLVMLYTLYTLVYPVYPCLP